MKTLLTYNEAAAESTISQKQAGYKNGVQLLAGLAKLGLELESVNNWETDVVPHFRTDFPNSTLDFNLDSRGIKDEFKALEAFYNKNRSGLAYTAPTEAEKEAIKEKYRIYANDRQIEASQLVNSIVDNINRLKYFNIPINSSYASQLCYVLRNKDGKVTVSNESLSPYLLKLE